LKSESSGPTAHPASVPEGDDVFTLRSTVWESSLGGVLSLQLNLHNLLKDEVGRLFGNGTEFLDEGA
jgi:hypothetical protein